MAKRKRTGTAGFYRAYPSGKFANIEEAIEAAMAKATELGWPNMRVNRQQTGLMPNGGYFVALTGRE